MTMLLISDRVRPCRARIGPSSLGRPTLISPSSWTTSIGRATVCFSSPLGPLTETSEDLRQVVLLRVDPQARLGHPLEPGDRALPARAELEVDYELLADLGVLHAP